MRSAFLASVPPAKSAAWEQIAELGRHLERAWEEARTVWPSFEVESEKFAGYLGERAPEEADVGGLDVRQTTDLYLACGCSSGQHRALLAFEKYCEQEWGRGTARYSLQASQALEIKQSLRTRLFVSSETHSGHIRRYSGKGALRAWYRTTVVRATIDYLRANDRQQRLHEQGDLDEHVALVDLELDYLKRNYREDFKHSFHAALRSLTSEDRNLLRYQLIEELTLEEIGLIYGLHLSSIARRLQKLREQLLTSTRAHLQERLGVGGGELDSIMRLIGSRLDVSISSVLCGASK
jgi:RNA polymerase sigma-70 factor (ECF subfamily)